MTIKLLDYAGKPSIVDVGEIDTIAKMSIRVVSGDEILTVIYKNYETKTFDSSDCRMVGYYDGRYELYDFNNPKLCILNDEAFVNRTSSYWFW